jgi:hypothetical protein
MPLILLRRRHHSRVPPLVSWPSAVTYRRPVLRSNPMAKQVEPEDRHAARRQRLRERLRAEFIAGAEEDSRRRLGRSLTAEELERVLRRYPGDCRISRLLSVAVCCSFLVGFKYGHLTLGAWSTRRRVRARSMRFQGPHAWSLESLRSTVLFTGPISARTSSAAPAQGTARASGNPFRRVPWLTSHAGSATI